MSNSHQNQFFLFWIMQFSKKEQLRGIEWSQLVEITKNLVILGRNQVSLLRCRPKSLNSK
jgi:hypothetical protein